MNREPAKSRRTLLLLLGIACLLLMLNLVVLLLREGSGQTNPTPNYAASSEPDNIMSEPDNTVLVRSSDSTSHTARSIAPVPGSGDSSSNRKFNPQPGVIMGNPPPVEGLPLLGPLPGGIGVVDLARLIAEHPLAKSQEAELNQKRADLLAQRQLSPAFVPLPIENSQELARQDTELRARIFSEIQPAIAALAAAHNCRIVLDSSAKTTRETTAILSAAETIDLTAEVRQELMRLSASESMTRAEPPK